jgi:hypothetical protein
MHKTEQHSREGVLVERAQRAAVAADSGSQVLRHLGVHLFCRVFCTCTTPKKKEEKNKSRRSMIELEISKSEGIYIMKSLFELT